MSDPHSARLVQRIGLGLIAAGLVAGTAAYVCAARAEADVDDLARQREMYQVERLGGTATVQTVKFDQWLASLWHGERLGVTLVVLGFVLGGACWYVGGLMGEDVGES